MSEPKKVSAVKAGAQSKVTTGIGLVAGLPILFMELLKLADKDAATSPNWELLALTVMGMLVAFFAGDANKSSEDAGAA